MPLERKLDSRRSRCFHGVSKKSGRRRMVDPVISRDTVDRPRRSRYHDVLTALLIACLCTKVSVNFILAVVCLSERHKHASLIWLISASTLCKSELMRFRHRVRFALQPAIWKVAGSIVYWYSKLPATEGSMGSFSGRQCATNKPNSLLSSRSHGHWPGNIAKHRVHGPTCASHWVYTEVQSC